MMWWVHWKIPASVVIYSLSVSLVPIINKEVFSGVETYPYPLATAFLQLGAVAAVLVAASTARARPSESWIGGPHLLFKLRHVGPVGFLFGLKYSVTNLGLELVPIGVHVLLQSSDVVWTCLFAWCINRERRRPTEYFAVLCCMLGSTMVAFRAEARHRDVTAFGIVVNLLLPVNLALCVAFMRRGVVNLAAAREKEARAGLLEFTALKLSVSCLTALGLAMLAESGFHDGGTPWWTALAAEPRQLGGQMVAGAAAILIFQVNMTWLAWLTSAVTCGVVGQFKIVPQWLFSRMYADKLPSEDPLNLAGFFCLLASCGLYAASALKASRRTPDGRESPSVRTGPDPAELPPELLLPLLAPAEPPPGPRQAPRGSVTAVAADFLRDVSRSSPAHLSPA
jgi:drug/metabolite transporter (DMT)-like permease